MQITATSPDSPKMPLNFSAVSETLFLPLYSRAIESQSANPIITDPESIRLVGILDREFAHSGNPMLQAMIQRRLPVRLPVSMALRTRAFDRIASAFIAEHPDAVVINLGCGLDTRFFRVDNEKIDWYNIDLPPVIALRTSLLPAHGRQHDISASVLEPEWLRMVATGTRKVLIIAEGLFMYLEEDRVRELLLGIQRKFPGCELAAEVFSATWIKRLRSPYIRRKFRRQLHMNDDALFTFGVEDSRAFERIGPGFSLIGEWSYFDDKEKKLGWYNFLGKFSAFKKIQWMVRYRIDLQ